MSASRRSVIVQGLAAVTLICLLSSCMVTPRKRFQIKSDVMLPTYQSGDVLVVDRVAYSGVAPSYSYAATPAVGDIIVMNKPDESEHPFVERIVAVGGDRVSVREGKLWRNGKAVTETYIKEPMDYTWPQTGEVVVPVGHVAVLGDNRNDSYDSHLWPSPYVPLTDIIGKVVTK